MIKPLLILALAVTYAFPAGNPVTMAAFGNRIVTRGMANQDGVTGGGWGDTWDGAWSYDDSVYLQMNDGNGAGGGLWSHDRICRLFGTPENRNEMYVIDSNPGILGGSLSGPCYATGTYEVDSVLYHIISYSTQGPLWLWHRTNILKSTDKGANWTNPLGQLNTFPPDEDDSSMFPDWNWGFLNFVKYGRGGEAPDVDNARTYVYLAAQGTVRAQGMTLVRVKRSDLPLLDKNLYEYYAGGDGMVDSAWSKESSAALLIPGSLGIPSGMIYNFGLQRYLMTYFSGNSWENPPLPAVDVVLEAPHPWGPWTTLLDENVNASKGDYLGWTFLMQKFTSIDGKKMWISASGRAPYGLQFMPIYLTTHPVTVREAEGSRLSGVQTDFAKPGYSSSGYVTRFDQIGDECRFMVYAESTGIYMVKIRYNASADQPIGFYINDTIRVPLKLGTTEQSLSIWTDLSLFVWLEQGFRYLTVRFDSASTGDFNLDNLSYAFYSSQPGAAPVVPAPPPAPPRPFGGAPWPMPGRIEAKNFDLGGEGSAYHDLSLGNEGQLGLNNFRDTEDVDIGAPWSSDEGREVSAVSWIKDGEWLAYTVDIPVGEYDITARAASGDAGSGMGLTVKLDSDSLGVIPITQTAGWAEYQSFTLPNITISRGGTRVLRLITNILSGGNFNLNWIQVTPSSGSGLETLPAAEQPFQAYPNPFNPSVNVRFTLNEKTAISLLIYDIRGLLVRTLIQGEQAAGRHAIVWDGHDNGGRALSSGIYMIQYAAEGREKIKRIQLIK